MKMTNHPGYEVIRKAIPKDLAQRATKALLARPKLSKEKYDAFEMPPICDEIIAEFLNKFDKSAIERVSHPKVVQPKHDHVFAGLFRETLVKPDTTYTAFKDEIYATIALTPLSPGNGWYIFYEGTRANISEVNVDTKKATLSLDIGDVVVWRGDLLYFHTTGGGGMFQTIAYKVV
ncbi:uncharacterized protein BDV14DRAFT_23743 [Aspergillus stella-maris]|uniref:uncharacterized protein n=1 Tax=Aspergillus stella-maris TaxID=1810926 RepID=UPI003CCE4FE3